MMKNSTSVVGKLHCLLVWLVLFLCVDVRLGMVTVRDVSETVRDLRMLSDLSFQVVEGVLHLDIELDGEQFHFELNQATDLFSKNCASGKAVRTFQSNGMDENGHMASATILSDEKITGVLFLSNMNQTIEFNHGSMYEKALGAGRFRALAQTEDSDVYFASSGKDLEHTACGEEHDNKEKESAAVLGKYLEKRKAKVLEKSFLRKSSNPFVYYGGSDCYEEDNTLHRFSIGIIADKTFVALHGKNTDSVIAQLVSAANIVYKYQFNMELQVGDIRKYGESGNTHNIFKTCYGGTGDSLNVVEGYAKSIPADEQQGHWHVVTNCYPLVDGKVSVVGTANLGTAGCYRARYGWHTAVSTYTSAMWRTFAHEVAHGLNAQHSFENGIGKTGGLMDYGDGKINGEYRFQPSRGDEICSLLEYTKNTKCGFLFPASQGGPNNDKPTKSPTRQPTAQPTEKPTQADNGPCGGLKKKQCRKKKSLCVFTSNQCVEKEQPSSGGGGGNGNIVSGPVYTPQPCVTAGSYEAAVEACAASNHRLCTDLELQEAANDPTCNLDKQFVWTSSPCKSGFNTYMKTKNKRKCRKANTRKIKVRCC